MRLRELLETASEKTVAKTWDEMTPKEKSSGVKGRTVWNEKTRKYRTVFDVPAKLDVEQGVAEGNYQHNYGYEFKDFKTELEKKHGRGNVKIVGDGNVADAYHVKTGKHLGFIDGSHAEVNEQGVAEAEGDSKGVPHLTKELLKHIVDQIGTEGAHAIVKSIEWGDGAAKELLQLIKHDLENHIELEESVKQRLDKSCWSGYKKSGTKMKAGVRVNNCVPESLESQFDIIEEWVEQLAEHHGVDSDVIWEDFESVNDRELLDEAAAWQKKSGKNKNGGLNQKGVDSYRKEHPGSKLQTAVTTPPSKLKKGSKAAKRRKSFCARMGGMKGPMKDDNGKPTRKALALKKWNC